MHRGHSDDVLDLSWSHDGSGIVSTSIENSVIIWDADKCKAKVSTNLAFSKSNFLFTYINIFFDRQNKMFLE